MFPDHQEEHMKRNLKGPKNAPPIQKKKNPPPKVAEQSKKPSPQAKVKKIKVYSRETSIELGDKTLPANLEELLVRFSKKFKTHIRAESFYWGTGIGHIRVKLIFTDLGGETSGSQGKSNLEQGHLDAADHIFAAIAKKYHLSVGKRWSEQGNRRYSILNPLKHNHVEPPKPVKPTKKQVVVPSEEEADDVEPTTPPPDTKASP